MTLQTLVTKMSAKNLWTLNKQEIWAKAHETRESL